MNKWITAMMFIVGAAGAQQTPNQFAANQDVEHAPTVAQCQAEQRLWRAEIEESVQDHSAHLPGIHGIRECEKVDPENRLRYHNIESELTVEEKMRMEDFLHHHQLWDKFITADADGER
jgi:hypothetical protein